MIFMLHVMCLIKFVHCYFFAWRVCVWFSNGMRERKLGETIYFKFHSEFHLIAQPNWISFMSQLHVISDNAMQWPENYNWALSFYAYQFIFQLILYGKYKRTRRIMLNIFIANNNCCYQSLVATAGLNIRYQRYEQYHQTSNNYKKATTKKNNITQIPITNR